MAEATRVTGSYRDFDSRVFAANGEIFRSLSNAGLEDFNALAATELFGRAQEDGSLVRTEVADGVEPPPECAPPAGLAAVLRHERVPFVSWPFEWPFAMLRDAALLVLELTSRSVDEGLILKDATPYNIQWRGAAPVFIDVGSFEKLREGEPWFGYRQFCMQCLYPLMLMSYRGVSYRPFLRGRIDGIPPEDMSRLLSFRDRFRRGVITNVSLLARLERRHADRSASDARQELKKAGFKPELIKANVDRLTRLVRKLEWGPGKSEWSEYREEAGYSEDELSDKDRFVEQAVESRSPDLVWDLGANDGRFSRIAARHAGYVLAVDGDELAVDRLYRQLRDEGETKILPLVLDLVDASPGSGWRGAERPRLEQRGLPDLVLALALVHHLAIGANVPVVDLVDWFASLGAPIVVEFPTRDDPMVAKLLSRKREGAHPDYELEVFEAELGRRFEIERRQELGSRVMFEARPR